jgi:hypothetical protein
VNGGAWRESATDILNCGVNSVISKEMTCSLSPGAVKHVWMRCGCILEAVVVAAFC